VVSEIEITYDDGEGVSWTEGGGTTVVVDDHIGGAEVRVSAAGRIESELERALQEIDRLRAELDAVRRNET